MKKKIIFPLLITALLIGLLLMYVELEDIIETLFSMSPIWLLIGFGSYLFTLILRTLRFRLLLNGKVDFNTLLYIVFIHNMFNNLMPLRMGEVSYIYLLKKKEDIPKKEGVSTLIIARIFDSTAISLVFLSSVILVEKIPEVMLNLVSAVAIFLLMALLFLFSMIFLPDRILNFMEILTMKLNLRRLRLMDLVFKGVSGVIEELKVCRSYRISILSFTISVMIWCFVYFTIYALVRGIGLNLGIFEVILGSSFAIFTMILPIQGFGNFGSYEAAWSIVFISLGVSTKLAIASGFAVHITLFLFFLILGGIGVYRLCRGESIPLNID